MIIPIVPRQPAHHWHADWFVQIGDVLYSVVMDTDHNAPIVGYIPIAGATVKKANIDAEFMDDPSLLGRQSRGQVKVGSGQDVLRKGRESMPGNDDGIDIHIFPGTVISDSTKVVVYVLVLEAYSFCPYPILMEVRPDSVELMLCEGGMVVALPPPSATTITGLATAIIATRRKATATSSPSSHVLSANFFCDGRVA